MKAWGGRFEGPTEPLMERFSSSIQVDWRLFRHDIEGSIAYAEMLERIGILTRDECGRVTAGLQDIENEISNGDLPFRDDLEDIHMHVEARLIEKVGEAGKKLHTGRSRNEQVALDMRMYVKEQIDAVDERLKALLSVMVDRAEVEKAAIMPGYTHTRKAQVVPFSHYLLSYYYMLKRDRQRLAGARTASDVLPLGSGALAGSTLPIDREFLRERLGFASICQNSMDGASDRDFVLDTLYAIASIMTHLSRLCGDLILYSTEEYGFIALPDSLCTGSSLMPHKKNPDALELVRGKSAACISDLFNLFTLTKGLPSTYNRDLQEDKAPLFRSFATVLDALAIMERAVQGMSLKAETMERAVVESFMPAVEMAEYLAARGVPFREAHHIVGSMVRDCEEKKRYLWQIPIEEMKAYSAAFDASVFDYIDPRNVVASRKTAGGASYVAVDEEIEAETTYLNR